MRVQCGRCWCTRNACARFEWKHKFPLKLIHGFSCERAQSFAFENDERVICNKCDHKICFLCHIFLGFPRARQQSKQRTNLLMINIRPKHLFYIFFFLSLLRFVWSWLVYRIWLCVCRVVFVIFSNYFYISVFDLFIWWVEWGRTKMLCWVNDYIVNIEKLKM